MLVLGTAAVALAGCGIIPGIGGGSSDPYAIATNGSSYDRGSTGEATIRNASGETLQYNLCPRRLERRERNSWLTAYEWPVAGGACTTELRRLGRDESVNALFEIPTGVPAGTYRVVFTQLLGENGRNILADQAATPAFEVR